jgi:hypothetical protein
MKQRLVYGLLFSLLGVFSVTNARFYSASGSIADNSETIERIVNSGFAGLDFTGSAAGEDVVTVPVTFYFATYGRSVIDVFIAGSMNNYESDNQFYKLSKKSDGLYSITLNLAVDEYVYKFVVDGNWENDPYNPEKDGSEYDNSKIYVSDPMITYFLPAFNESYSSTNMPHLTAYVASAETPIDLSDFTLEINGQPAQATPAYDVTEKKLTYTPLPGELAEGENTGKLTLTVNGVGVSKTIRFQYSSEPGGGDGDTFTVSGFVNAEHEGYPIEGVAISNGSDIAYTNTEGYYSLDGCSSDMDIIASKEGFSFEPEKIYLADYDSDVLNANFFAIGQATSGEIIPYTVSGTVTICGTPVEGVQVESRGKTVYTAADGTYSITDTVMKDDWVHTPMGAEINISSSDYVFNPAYQGINLQNTPTYTFTDIDFTGANLIDSITGNITHLNGTPFANLPMNLQMIEAVDWMGIDFDNLEIISDSIIQTDTLGNYIVPFFYSSYNQDGTGSAYIYLITPMHNEYSFDSEYFINNSSIIVYSSASCDELKNKDIIATYVPVPICMVSVTDNNNNTVVWEKPDSEEITGFGIYRESDVADEYAYIDAVPYDSIAVFTDLTSNPSKKAYRYKISTNLKHGYDVMSDTHKTIHLTINKGTGNNWNLIWSHYEGLNITTYKLYRGADENSMQFLTDIAGNLNSYTDAAPSDDDFFYQIEMVIPEACNPEVAKPILKGLTSENNYSSTKSNIVNTTISSEGKTGIVADMGWIYPNPVKNTLYLNNITDLSGYEIFSIHGVLIRQGKENSAIEVSGLETGLYYLRVYSPNQWSVYKFVKE